MLVKFMDGTSREVELAPHADLRGADLYGANLRNADLRGADLGGADLGGADLGGADLGGADLISADLISADLRGANLRGANLISADLSSANLSSADLRGANLRGAVLGGAVLGGAAGLAAFTVCAPEGALIGWKKLADDSLVKLLIPADAARVNAYGSRKCRAEYATVLEGSGTSQHDAEFTYATGETVRPDTFDPDPCVECSHGIHFFITREEAEQY